LLGDTSRRAHRRGLGAQSTSRCFVEVAIAKTGDLDALARLRAGLRGRC
jgi:hypothetical protein